VVVLAAGATGAYLLATRDRGDEPKTRPKTLGKVSKERKKQLPVPSAPDASATPDAAVAARSPDQSTAPRAPAAHKRGRPRPLPLSPAHAAELRKARKLLRAGRLADAAAIAERLIRNLPESKRWPAHEILARVACTQSRLPAFRAHLANVPRRRRRAIKRYCSRYMDVVD
jgi:hypothetical protein